MLRKISRRKKLPILWSLRLFISHEKLRTIKCKRTVFKRILTSLKTVGYYGGLALTPLEEKKRWKVYCIEYNIQFV